jgi:hypothetical protein
MSTLARPLLLARAPGFSAALQYLHKAIAAEDWGGGRAVAGGKPLRQRGMFPPKQKCHQRRRRPFAAVSAAAPAGERGSHRLSGTRAKRRPKARGRQERGATKCSA